ncbi:hypothetical protein [Candidatus Flexifilum breve]|uniref:hypothetical protein n=1 Tax=Candidatus Flexifilum breve TaxID=3140694 RepID=UPI0031CCA84C
MRRFQRVLDDVVSGNLALPVVGGMNPVSIRMVVVLPAPFPAQAKPDDFRPV